MSPARLSSDDGARAPFAVVAVLLLISTAFLAALVSLTVDDMPKGRAIGGERMTVALMEDGLRVAAVSVATGALDNALAAGRDIEAISADIEDAFGASVLGCAPEGWSLSVEDATLGVDLGAHEPMGRVVGTVHWSALSPRGSEYRRVTRMHEGLDGPYGTLIGINDKVVVSGDEGGDIAEVVRYMLFKLAAVRAAGGELDASRVLTERDIDIAVRLALDRYLDSSSRGRGSINGTGQADPDIMKDPADLFLERRNITTIRSSAIMGQYLVGLLDYYVLWLVDYIGIGEGVESFFEWAGECITGDTTDEEDLARAREEWWRGFKVAEELERWAHRLLSGILHLVLEMMGDEEIDVRDMDIDDVAGAVDRAIGVEGDVVPPEPSEDEGSAGGLEEAIDNMPGAKEEGGEGLIGRLRDLVVGAFVGHLEPIVEVARGIAARAWRQLADMDEAMGISNITDAALLPVECRDPEAKVRLEAVSVGRENLSLSHSIRARGAHNTAPEDRLGRLFDAIRDPGGGALLSDIRPYETDYEVSVVGGLDLRYYDFTTVDVITGLEEASVIEVSVHVPINISIVIPVLTGVPLEGVDYNPTDDLVGDLKEAAWAFVNWTWSGLQWAAGAVGRLFDGFVDGLGELGRRGHENLGSMSAAVFSKVVEDLLRMLYQKAWNDALNLTWRFLRALIGDDLREMLTFHIDIWGFRLTVQIDFFEETLTVSHDTGWYGFAIVTKRLVEEDPPFRPRPVEGFTYSLVAEGYLVRGGLWVEATVDPLTILGPSIVHIFGESRDDRGEGVRFELSAPVARRALEVEEVSISSLSGGPIRGIPLPGTGMRVDLDAGVRLKHGTGIKDPYKLIVGAVKDAWYKTLGGYSVKELYGELGDPVLLEAFVVQLLNNIVNGVGEELSEEVPELEVFLEGGLSTAGGAAAGGFSLAFVIKDPLRVLWDIVPWLVDNLRAFILRMSGTGVPSGLVSLPSSVMENLFVRFELYAEVGAPDLLGGKRTGSVRLGGMLEANLPALAAVVGKDVGRWMVRGGIVIHDIPSAAASLIPGFRAPRPRCDLWMVEVSIMELDNDGALLGEVYYDTSGTDADEEYIEVWNPTGSRVDLSRWIVEDNGGHWRLPDHLSVPSGGRLVIARDRDGMRAAFGILPDVDGLPLSLNNEGDAVRLYDPYWVMLDSVGWEGGIHGWDMECDTGESLHRGQGDTDSPRDWYCAAPRPGL